MDFPRVSRPVAILLFLLAVFVIVVVPMMCAIGSANDPDTPPDADVEAVPDVLE